MIKEYFENYFEKIKDTKKIARDKNIGVWWMPVFDSFLITIYFSWQLSVGVWIALDAWQSGQDYVPWYMDSLWEISSFSLTIFMSIITFTVLDKIILSSTVNVIILMNMVSENEEISHSESMYHGT